MITKGAVNPHTGYRCIRYYKQARAALLDLLKQTDNNTVVLLLAFIGYSPHEGSGIFDPVVASGRQYDFYKIDEQLFVDMDDFTNKCEQFGKRAFILIVHYFGFVDPHYEEMLDVTNRCGSIVVEDCAHALYTSLWQ